jgi:hypothetical protein
MSNITTTLTIVNQPTTSTTCSSSTTTTTTTTDNTINTYYTYKYNVSKTTTSNSDETIIPIEIQSAIYPYGAWRCNNISSVFCGTSVQLTCNENLITLTNTYDSQTGPLLQSYVYNFKSYKDSPDLEPSQSCPNNVSIDSISVNLYDYKSSCISSSTAGINQFTYNINSVTTDILYFNIKTINNTSSTNLDNSNICQQINTAISTNNSSKMTITPPTTDTSFTTNYYFYSSSTSSTSIMTITINSSYAPETDTWTVNSVSYTPNGASSNQMIGAFACVCINQYNIPYLKYVESGSTESVFNQSYTTTNTTYNTYSFPTSLSNILASCYVLSGQIYDIYNS